MEKLMKDRLVRALSKCVTAIAQQFDKPYSKQVNSKLIPVSVFPGFLPHVVDFLSCCFVQGFPY